jgi:hypothetical protein
VEDEEDKRVLEGEGIILLGVATPEKLEIAWVGMEFVVEVAEAEERV